MRSLLGSLGCVGLLLGFLVSAVLAEQPVKPAVAPPKPGVHVMQILSGPYRTVHYFGTGLSSGEETSLADLERAENDAGYGAQLQALKRQYVADERVLQRMRRNAQQDVYGAAGPLIGASLPGYTSLNFFPGTFGGYTSIGYPFGGYPYATPALFTPGYLGGSGAAGIAAAGFSMGDEGVLKNTVAQAIAKEAGGEYAGMAAKQLADARMRASESNQLRTALNPSGTGEITPAASSRDKPFAVVLTLKGGDVVQGDKMREDGDWYVVETDKEEMRVRKGDVVRMKTLKAGAKP